MKDDHGSNLAAAQHSVGWAREAPQFHPIGEPWMPVTDVRMLAPFETIAPVELGAWIDRLRRAGIAADRRNSPNLFGQLTQALRRPIDTVLCGVLDVDPAACLNSALASRFPLELAAGMVIIGHVTHAQRSAIITDIRVPEKWFSSLTEVCSEIEIYIEPIINDYPQADPTLMLYALLGRRLRPERLPTDQGVVLIDAAAAIAIGRYALLDEPMLQSAFTIRDHTLDRSLYLTAPMGVTPGELFQQLQLPLNGRTLRAGDLLRDQQIRTDAVLGGGELIIHSTLPRPPINPSPCIRCGWCVDSCPTRVQPATVLEACQLEDIELAERAGIEACIECGVCSYVCPSQLPLLEGIRQIKQKIDQASLQPTEV